MIYTSMLKSEKSMAKDPIYLAFSTQKGGAGKTTLQTDMFEAIVSASPEGADKVYDLMDSYLKAYYRRIAERAAESPPSQVSAPEDFDVQNYV